MTESWDFSVNEKKRQDTIRSRGLDLLDLRQLFDGRPQYTYPSPRRGEERFTTVAELHGKLCAVAWAFREDGGIHLITAHRAQMRQEREFDRLGLGRQAHADVSWWDGRTQRSPSAQEQDRSNDHDDGMEIE